MFTKEFDPELKEISHFKKFPSLMPFIGENYGRSDIPKLLLIAESHYLPEGSKASKNISEWYGDKLIELSSEEIRWMNTRGVTSSNWESHGHMIFRELEKRMNPHIERFNGRSMNNCAYINGFQRPSPQTGDSIKNFCQDLDYVKSAEILSTVITIIKPDFIVFVSKLSWDKLAPRIAKTNKSLKMDYVCHPGTGGRYWHNKSYKHGSQKFSNILSKYISK